MLSNGMNIMYNYKLIVVYLLTQMVLGVEELA